MPEPVIDLQVSVSSTTVYKSAVVQQGARRVYFEVDLTSTATGKLRGQINNLDESAYQKAVAAAGSEAANTTGWYDEPLTVTDVPPHSVEATGEINLDGAGRNFATLNMPPGPKRRRLTYTNATNTGVLTVRRRFV